MSGHTPGPWVNDFEESGRICDAAGHDMIRIYVDPHSGRDFETGKANARLIAAAPDLLEAVQSLVYLVKESGFRSGLTEEAFDEALMSGIAAIEKARGGA